MLFCGVEVNVSGKVISWFIHGPNFMPLIKISEIDNRINESKN